MHLLSVQWMYYHSTLTSFVSLFLSVLSASVPIGLRWLFDGHFKQSLMKVNHSKIPFVRSAPGSDPRPFNITEIPSVGYLLQLLRELRVVKTVMVSVNEGYKRILIILQEVSLSYYRNQ